MTFLEGYLWGPERPRAAMLEAARIAHAAGRTVAFTLSESLCIAGRREGVMGMIEAGTVDILFGNEDEVRHLTGCDDLDDCLAAAVAEVPTLVITRGAAGRGRDRGRRARRRSRRRRSTKVVDTTGAGDLFAAGFLAAPLPRARRSGAASTPARIAAAEVISHFGARPEADLQGAGAPVNNVRRLAVYCGSAPGVAARVRRRGAGDRASDGRGAASTWSMAAAGSG